MSCQKCSVQKLFACEFSVGTPCTRTKKEVWSLKSFLHVNFQWEVFLAHKRKKKFGAWAPQQSYSGIPIP